MRLFIACLVIAACFAGQTVLSVLPWRTECPLEPESAFSSEPAPAFHMEQAASPFHVEPYLQLPTPDGMTIMWEMKEKLPGVVEYGLTEELGQIVEAKAPARLHQVRLERLKPGTRYYYRVRSGDAVSKINRFRTAPPPGTNQWKMALYGDSRSNPNNHRKVVEQVAKHDVDLILHTGDIVLDGRRHELWRKEFFAPLEPIAGSVPWVSTIGNHERDADNYFSYAALPGNEHYFGFDFANAHIVCLDSNSWIERGRDSKQYQWAEEHFKKKRDATWTLVAFHHPLFSAHRSRSINALRWEWAPLLLDPGCKIDGVLTGHDHFYARNYPMARMQEDKVHPVLFLTSAGGGANLYPIKQRDYVAKTESVHHFTLFEFDGDQVTLSAIDVTGRVFDRHVLKKDMVPQDQVCAYEIEELKEALRRTLAAAKPVEVVGGKPARLDTTLEVPNRFGIPVKGKLVWQDAPGWKMARKETPFELQPKEPLRIAIQAEVEAKGLGAAPMLNIEFEPGKFRNRIVEVYPVKLTGPARVPATTLGDCKIDGQFTGAAVEAEWLKADSLYLLPTATGATTAGLSQVWLASDGKQLYVAARLIDPDKAVQVTPPDKNKEPSRLVLSSEHFRVELDDGQDTHVFALSAENIPYHTIDGKEKELTWPAMAIGGDGCWTAEMAIPLNGRQDRSKLRINIVHRSKGALRDYELRPTYGLDANPDIIPAWKASSSPERFAELKLP